MTRLDLRVEGAGAGRTGAPPPFARSLAVAASLAAPALLAHAWPTLGTAFEYERTRVASGEIWRIVTCHFTHWTADHLVWDLVAFVVLTVLCRRICGARLYVALACAALVVPLAVAALLPEMDRYRGLSGLDSALYALLGVSLLRRALASGARASSLLLSVALAAFAAKIGFEVATGSPAFVASGTFVPVPWAHVAGAVVGAAVALAGTLPETRGRSFPRTAELFV